MGCNFDRLVSFLDFLSRSARGRQVLFVMVVSALASGNMGANQPFACDMPRRRNLIINQYIINVPHECFKVYGLGDAYGPKNVSY